MRPRRPRRRRRPSLPPPVPTRPPWKRPPRRLPPQTATRSAAEMMEQAKRDIGKFDKELRKEFATRGISKPPDSPQLRLAQGIEDVRRGAAEMVRIGQDQGNHRSRPVRPQALPHHDRLRHLLHDL
ncbi:hypothetical protein LP420_33120 [Massilia sp. B-10]|nr:hypothetical protein LP420_33120 [Massilia sp. B-10]